MSAVFHGNALLNEMGIGPPNKTCFKSTQIPSVGEDHMAHCMDPKGPSLTTLLSSLKELQL